MAKKKTPAKKAPKRAAKPASGTKKRTGGAKKAPAKKTVKKATRKAAAKPAARKAPKKTAPRARAQSRKSTAPVPKKKPAQRKKATPAKPKPASKRAKATGRGGRSKPAEKGGKKPTKQKRSKPIARESAAGTRPVDPLAIASRDRAESKRTKETLKEYTRSKKHTPAVFKLPSKKHTPIVFSLEDVREALKKSQTEALEAEKTEAVAEDVKVSKSKRKVVTDVEDKPEHRVHGAALVADILGFNPTAKAKSKTGSGRTVPRKFSRYYKMLVALREHVKSGLDMRTRDTLKRSNKEDTGDLSSYSQHMADAGTDNFDRDFALSLVSSEQDALFEIEEAIQRIYDGSYGICEITGKPINKDRLEAVPFTRYSVEGQRQFESTGRKKEKRTGVFIDSSVEAAAQFTDDDSGG